MTRRTEETVQANMMERSPGPYNRQSPRFENSEDRRKQKTYQSKTPQATARKSPPHKLAKDLLSETRVPNEDLEREVQGEEFSPEGSSQMHPGVEIKRFKHQSTSPNDSSPARNRDLGPNLARRQDTEKLGEYLTPTRSPGFRSREPADDSSAMRPES